MRLSSQNCITSPRNAAAAGGGTEDEGRGEEPRRMDSVRR